MKKEIKELLETLIPTYAKEKAEADYHKKLADKNNTEIKQVMRSNDIPEYSAGDVTAKCSVSYREEFDEEALLEKLKSLKLPKECKVIRRKEYVDMDALESAIYNGYVNAAELASCQTRKEIVTLRISGGKK